MLALLIGTAPASADAAKDAISRYEQAMAEQRATPGPDVPATPALVDAAHAAILAILKDPESSRWGSVRFFQAPHAGGVHACGNVNAKNSFGGYTGEVPFFVHLVLAGAAWQAKDADISSPNRGGWFFTVHPFCNPLAW